MASYRFVFILFKILTWLITTIKIEGLENVPPTGPYILAVNHRGLMDSPVVFISIPAKRIVPFAADKWGKAPIIGLLLKMMGTIFVARGEVDRKALGEAIKALKEGEVLGVAPEGTRSSTGVMQRAKPGIAYMATRANAPVLPMGISGEVALRQLFRFKRLHLRLKIGPLIYLPPVSGPDKMARLQDYADNIMIAIARLIDPELRGVYAQAAETGSFKAD